MDTIKYATLVCGIGGLGVAFYFQFLRTTSKQPLGKLNSKQTERTIRSSATKATIVALACLFVYAVLEIVDRVTISQEQYDTEGSTQISIGTKPRKQVQDGAKNSHLYSADSIGHPDSTIFH